MLDNFPITYYFVGSAVVLVALITAFYVWNTWFSKCKQP